MHAKIRNAVAQGQPVPDLLPHPDDIELNLSTGDVVFHGPVNADDKSEWDRLWGLKEGYLAGAEKFRI